MTAEIIVQAIRLCILTIGYAFELARKHEQAVADAKAKRALFEKAVALALERMRTDTIEEKNQVDAVDEEIDKTR